MENNLTSLLFQTIGLGILSFFWVVLNWRTYRNPDWPEKSTEGFYNQWFKSKAEDKQQLQQYERRRRQAILMLILSIIPVSMFLASCFVLIATLWLRFR